MVDFGQLGLLTVDYGAAHRVFWGGVFVWEGAEVVLYS